MSAWGEFAITFFFGMFGVHKFMKKDIKMGLIYFFTLGLFSIGWIIDCVKSFMTALRGESSEFSALNTKNKNYLERNLDENEPLPVVQPKNTILLPGEICHYSESARYFTTKNVVVGYQGGGGGVSIRVMKGMSLRTGSSKVTPIRKNVQEEFPGTLTITNKRIIFSGLKGSFDKKITSLSSITPYSDAVAFQFGTQNYPLLVDTPLYISQVIERIINQPEQTET